MEQISVFDIFKIGVGPSSSHTMGPWRAALFVLQFVHEQKIKAIHIKLYGSLAKTGRGHGTDIAVMLGLLGHHPVDIDTARIDEYINAIYQEKALWINQDYPVPFHPLEQIEFIYESLPFHPNALTFCVTLEDDTYFERTYYSVGGGFVTRGYDKEPILDFAPLPYPINKESDLKNWLISTNALSISHIVLQNELAWRDEQTVKKELLNIWETMLACVYKGCHVDGILPGGLEVKRRAALMNQQLVKKAYQNPQEWIVAIRETLTSFSNVSRWVSCFALAVNEENASFGRVVTAPTNGAAGVIPAVLMYYYCFCENADENGIINFLLTAGEIGSLFKKGSTISAAQGGCQAEIGVSSAMAAAGLTECLGGSPQQALMAAEIAMEHHLGLTCDPISGLVQIPCIERNTMGAIKAITASQLALSSDPQFAKVSLDGVIKTMWETAKDMNNKYKETSDGGLAVNIPVIVAEC